MPKSKKTNSAKPAKVEFSPGVEFGGPPEMAQLWADFTAAYTENGQIEYNVTGVNLLNELAYCRDVAKFVDRHEIRFLPRAELEKATVGKSPAYIKNAYEHNEAQKQKYNKLRECINKAAEALSKLAEPNREEERPLNREILDKVLHAEWIKLEKKHRLYTDKGGTAKLDSQRGVKRDERDDVYRRRDKLRGSPEGGLVSSAMLFASDNTIIFRSNAVLPKFRRYGVTLDDVVEVARSKTFYDTLFSHDPKPRVNEEGKLRRAAKFSSFLQTSLKLKLAHHVFEDDNLRSKYAQLQQTRTVVDEDDPRIKHKKVTERKEISLSNPDPSGEGRGFADTLQDGRQESAEEIFMREEMRETVRRIMDKLNPREREIIELRFGFKAGTQPLTLEGTARKIGDITRERIRQIESRAIEKFLFWYEKEDRDKSPGFVREKEKPTTEGFAAATSGNFAGTGETRPGTAEAPVEKPGNGRLDLNIIWLGQQIEHRRLERQMDEKNFATAVLEAPNKAIPLNRREKKQLEGPGFISSIEAGEVKLSKGLFMAVVGALDKAKRLETEDRELLYQTFDEAAKHSAISHVEARANKPLTGAAK